jgi:Cu/Ag efflux pump CusA
MRVPKKEQCTYDEVADHFGMTTNKVHSVIKVAYNKMVDHLVDDKGYDILPAVLWLKTELRMSYKEAIDKLDDRNYNRIKQSGCDLHELFE